MDLSPDSPVIAIKGVGKAAEQRFATLGILTVQDLLFHLPSRFEDRRRLVSLAQLQPGAVAQVEGTVVRVEVPPRPRGALRLCLRDEVHDLFWAFFFHHTPRMRQFFGESPKLRLYGEARMGRQGWEFSHPEWSPAGTPLPAHLTPFYPTTDGLQQSLLRKAIDAALTVLPRLSDPLAPFCHDCPSLEQALMQLHKPRSLAGVNGPMQASGGNACDAIGFELQSYENSPVSCSEERPEILRLALEELLAHRLAHGRLALQGDIAAPVLAGEGKLWQCLLHSLPYRPTGAQSRVIEEIRCDLVAGKAMQRLLQGDVGAGKTLVAAAACLFTVEAGYQAALMAPTEILAQQHGRSLGQWLEPLAVPVVTMVQGMTVAEKREALAVLESEQPVVAVGTHALFQDKVNFGRLGLAIVDEQHRFGVEQRRKLREKGGGAHLLIMTATPIPRTLAMTMHADLDLSVLDEMPPGRQPIKTVAMGEERRGELLERLCLNAVEGHQAYWVCPLIEESEQLQAAAALESFQTLQESLPEMRIGLVHGRMKGEEKSAVMTAFKSGTLDLLVATTVIEVGVDVPNANVIVIENSERLGLAQLHQLRGRVGRGRAPSSCVLLYRTPLGAKARARIEAMRDSNDGFVLARRDLEMRGPGEYLGTRQAGVFAMKVANLTGHEHLLDRAAALEKVLDDQAKAVILQRWLPRGIDWGNIG